MSKRVIVIGAGPTGLMLAHELRLAGVAATVVEKRAQQSNLTRRSASRRAPSNCSTRAAWPRSWSPRGQAAHYRVGRVLLAGDAAHTHSPIGAQGMNTGLGDAMNLDWKLAAVVNGTAPSRLLDTFESERHPVGAKVLRLTDGLTRMVLIKSDIGIKLVQTVLKAVLRSELIRKHPRGLVSGISIAYEPRGEHPHRLAGTRALDVVHPEGRLYEDLRAAKFVLLDATPGGAAAAHAAAGWGDRIVARAVPPRTDGGPAVVLVRPDAYVAWASDTAPTEIELAAVLADWCGPAQVEAAVPQ